MSRFTVKAALARQAGFSLVELMISVVIGTLLGTLAAYRGGKIDQLITGLADLTQPFPAVMLNERSSTSTAC